jgi:hypothetical protein
MTTPGGDLVKREIRHLYSRSISKRDSRPKPLILFNCSHSGCRIL